MSHGSALKILAVGGIALSVGVRYETQKQPSS
jgi:hypothetical protein